MTAHNPEFASESQDGLTYVHAEYHRLLEQKYARDAEQFRVDFSSKLERHGAMHEMGGAALFHVPIIDGLNRKSYREVLLLHLPGRHALHDNQDSHPALERIIVNEPIVSEKDYQWLTFDFMLDEENDSQYFIDAVNERAQKISSTMAPLIFKDDRGGMAIRNFRPYTPVSSIGDQSISPQEALPFGHHSRISDMVDALELGQGLLKEIMRMEPNFLPNRVTFEHVINL